MTLRYEPATKDCEDAADDQDAGGGVPHVPCLAAAASSLQPQPQFPQCPGQALTALCCQKRRQCRDT